VEQFKKGAKATVTVVPAAAPEASVSLDVSLKGFTAGYEAVAATLQE
jgi:invasion protein IalB